MQHLDENPNAAFDFHNDPEAHDAILPQSPDLPWWKDKSHQGHGSKMISLLKILGATLQGAAAGAGAQNFGEGFRYAQQSAANLQRLQMQRDEARQMGAYRNAQIQRMNAQTAAYPQQQADLSSYRNARTKYLGAQTKEREAQIEKLKRGPNDKLLHSYQGQEGKVHMVFQRPDGATYEQSSQENFYTKPEQPQKPPRPLLGHGPDGGVYLIDPTTGHSRMVIRGKDPNAPRKRASADYFRKTDDWKSREWRKVVNDSLLSDEEKNQRLQDIQDHYERAIVTGGGDVNHYDVKSGFAQPVNGNNSNDPLGIR